MSTSAPETKLIKVLRTMLSFVLAVVISILSIAICFNTNFLDRIAIEKHFTSYEYVCGVRDNFADYVKSIYIRNGLPQDNVDEIISYSAVDKVAYNYAAHYINPRVGYDENTYSASIDDITNNLRADMAAQLELSKQQASDERLDELIEKISDYFNNETNLKGASYIEAIFNIGIPATYIIIGICIFLFIFITLILLFLGEKRYRAFRAVSISFLTAGLFDICLAFIVFIISRVRTFDIYPVYLFNEFMKYVNSCIAVVVAGGFITIMIALTVAAVTWINKNKR